MCGEADGEDKGWDPRQVRAWLWRLSVWHVAILAAKPVAGVDSSLSGGICCLYRRLWAWKMEWLDIHEATGRWRTKIERHT